MSFTTQRLLRNQRVRSDRTGMHFIIYHVPQFQEVGHSYCRRLVETFTGTTVIQVGCTVTRHTGFIGIGVDIVQACTVENRSSEFQSQFFTGPAQYSFENLSQVHTGRYTQRIQTNIHRSTVGQERHIFNPYNTGYDTFITVTSCHLITDLQFTFFRYVNFSHFDDAGRKFVSDSSIIFFTLHLSFDLLVFDHKVVQQITDHIVLLFICRPLVRIDFQIIQILQGFQRKLHAFRNNIFIQVILHSLRSLPIGQFEQFVDQQIG